MLRCPCTLEDACNDDYSHKTICVYYKSVKNYRILQLYSTAVKQCQLKTIFDHWDRTATLAVMYLEIKPQKKKCLFLRPFNVRR